MDRHDERDAMRQLGEDPGQVHVPRMAVHHLCIDRVDQHPEVAIEGRKQGAELIGCRAEVACRLVAAHPPPVSSLVVCAEGPHVELDQAPELAAQVVDMDAGAAIDRRGEFVGEQQRAHRPQPSSRR